MYKRQLMYYASKRKELAGLSSSLQSEIPQLYFVDNLGLGIIGLQELWMIWSLEELLGLKKEVSQERFL